MPEIRKSIATKEWVIIAAERARRPHECREPEHELTENRPEWVRDFPFCPGNSAAFLRLVDTTMPCLLRPAAAPSA